jgi:hypothetical protein
VYRQAKPATAARVPATTAMLTAETFADLPFGGYAGEWVSGGQAPPAPPPPQPLVIEPPEWAGQEADPTLAATLPSTGTERLDALAELRIAEGDNEIAFDPTLPIEEYPELVRFVPPEPDWQAEEAERDRQRAAAAQEALEPTRNPYPAKPGAERGPREP